ncbi:MAG TPA: EF-hand domain-containing protein [Ignavibacteria bacterium]
MTQAISGTSPYLSPTDFFKKMDTDSDGKVSKSELQAMLESMQKASNKNGTLNVDELFSKIDTDGDGSISETENTTAMEKMKGKGSPPPPPPPNGSSEIKSGIQNLISSLTESEDSESTSTLQSLLESLQESDDEESTTSILEQIREELLSLTQNNGDTYTSEGLSTSALIQSFINVKR